MKKMKQHYVWKNYLKPWTTNNKICCVRNGEIFEPNPIGIGQERHFYKLTELTSSEVDSIKKQFIRSPNAELNKFNEDGIAFFDYFFKIRSELNAKGLSSEEIEKVLDEEIHNLEENLHEHIEHNAQKYLDSLLAKDASFFGDSNSCIEFLHFICIQYFRTKNVQEIMFAQYKDTKEFRIEAGWPVIRHILAMNVASSIFHSRSQFNLLLMKNDSGVPFITSDQPVINTYAIRAQNNTEVKGLEFYYPISPSLAVLLSDRPDNRKLKIKPVTAGDVMQINTVMAHFSHEMIFAHSTQILEQFRKFQKSRLEN